MAASEAWVHPISTVALLVVLPSCAMDDRTLHPAEPGEATSTEDAALTSSGSGGTTSETATSTGSSGGTGGTGGSGGASSATETTGSETTGSVPANECPDLNQNQVLDCDETLAENATFAADTENWEADASAAIRWESAVSDPPSGVLVVTHADEGDAIPNQHTMAGSFQCVAVQGRSNYGFFAESFIPEGQGEALAAISGWFYGSSDCSGDTLEVINSPMLATTESWRVVHGSGVAPQRAQSLRVRLVAVKAEEEAAVEVRFDNVLVIRE